VTISHMRGQAPLEPTDPDIINRATIGPQASLLQYLDLPIENALRGWKIGAK